MSDNTRKQGQCPSCTIILYIVTDENNNKNVKMLMLINIFCHMVTKLIERPDYKLKSSDSCN